MPIHSPKPPLQRLLVPGCPVRFSALIDREIVLLLFSTGSLSTPTSCLAKTESSSDDQSEADINIPKPGRGSTSLHLFSCMGLFRCRRCCRSSPCLWLSMLRSDFLQHVPPQTSIHTTANKKKTYLYHSKCVAPLGHWLDRTGSGPELSPKHTPSDLFCWEVFLKYGLPVPFVATAGLLYSTWIRHLNVRWHGETDGRRSTSGLCIQTPVQLPVMKQPGQSARTHMPLSTYHQPSIAFHP